VRSLTVLVISCYVLTLFFIHTTSTCIVRLGDICSALRYSNQYLRLKFTVSKSLILSLPDEGYPRNASSALNLISTFLLNSLSFTDLHHLFHLNPISCLGGVALTSPSLHTERISEYKLNYPPCKFWTATKFLHAHLQVVYYNCVKFHKNPISCLGGVVLTRYMPSFFS
jgi:hypothetical protein